MLLQRLATRAMATGLAGLCICLSSPSGAVEYQPFPYEAEWEALQSSEEAAHESREYDYAPIPYQYAKVPYWKWFQQNQEPEAQSSDSATFMQSAAIVDGAAENKSGATPQALALPSGEGAVDGLGESFEPQLSTGTATFSLPVIVPPARGRVGPSLAFSYNSGGGQGIAGMGWSVGPPSIQRQTDKGLPRYDGTDRFMFNGEELVPVSLHRGNFLPAPTARPFRLKLEGRFWRFFYLPDATGERGTWLAQDKDGTQYFFGTSAGSRIENEQGTFRWSCSEVMDVHGNRAVYDYFADANGQSYLIAILYNEAADGSFKDRVGFNYEGRPDILTSYASGHRVTTVRRLSSVTVDSEYNMGADRRRVRRYHLAYVLQDQSYHSLLVSIRLIGNDGVTAYPPIAFGYTQVTGRETSGTPNPGIAIDCDPAQGGVQACHGEFDAKIRVMTPSPDRSVNDAIDDLLDVDGDALPDLFVTDPFRNSFSHTWIPNVAGSGFDINKSGNPNFYSATTGEQWLDGGASLTLDNRNVQLLDVDGNGFVDMLHMPIFASYNYYTIDIRPARPTWLKCDTTKCGPAAGSIPVQTQIDFRTGIADIKLFDVDNDHLIDVVMTTNGATKVWLNLGGMVDNFGNSGFGRFGNGFLTQAGAFDGRAIETCPLYKGLFIRFSDPKVTLGDMNGDGVQDIVYLERGQIAYWPGRGYGSFGTGPRACPSSAVGTNRHLIMDNSPYFSDLNLVATLVGDVDGDNLADLTEVMADSVRIWLNEGGHRYTEALLIQRTPEFATFTNRLRSADMNGSGSRDLVWGDAGLYRYIDLTGGEQPRILDHIDNGLGKMTDIEWESSTAHAHRMATNGCSTNLLCIANAFPPDRATGWQEHMPFPVHVVARVTVSDSMDAAGFPEGRYVTEYSYFDPYYDGAEHEFRGFAYAEVKELGDANSPTSLTKSWFFRGKPPEDESLKGMAFRTEVLDPAIDTPQATALRTEINQCTVQELFNGTDGRVVRQAYVSSTMTFLYDTANFNATEESKQLTFVRVLPLDNAPVTTLATFTLPGTPEAVTETAMELDDRGNEIEKIEYGRVESGNPSAHVGDERFTFTEWSFNEQTWVHRPVHSFVTGSDTTQRSTESFYCYDYFEPCGSGRLDFGDMTREEALIERDTASGDRRIVRVENDFDAFGHVIRTVQGQRQERRFDYGSSADRFFVYVSAEHGVVNATTTLTARAHWEPGFGQITRYEDYNFIDDFLAFTRIEYDPLGRVHKIHQPHVNVTGGTPVEGPCPTLPDVQIEYRLGAPVSSAAVFRRETECNATDLLRSVSYVDGLGRVRQTLSEDSGDPWIVTDSVTFDTKGGQHKALQPFFWSVSAYIMTGPQPVPAFQAAPDTAAPFTITTYDAYERTIKVMTEDGVSHALSFYHALSEDQFDENDTDLSAPIYNGTPKSLRRDGLGRLIEVIERNRTNLGDPIVDTHWLYRYDPIDDLTEVIDPAGNLKSQTFDSIGRKILIDDPNAGVWTFKYDNADNLIERIDGKLDKVVYTYDGAARMLTEDYFKPGGAPFPGMEIGVRYHYDRPFCATGNTACETQIGGEQRHIKGRLSFVEDLTGTSFFSYDARRRIGFRTREIDGQFFKAAMHYDDLDRETVLTYPDATTVSYIYSTRGLLVSIPNFIDNISYNAAGQRLNVDLADDADTQRTSAYDVRLRPDTLKVEQTLAPTHVLLDEQYVLDRASNFAAILDRRTATEVATWSSIPPADRNMTYDALYQLTQTTGRFGTESFAYDDVANLTHRDTDDGSGAGGEFFDETPGDYIYSTTRPYAVEMVHKGAISNPANCATENLAFFEYDDSGNLTDAQICKPGFGVIELRLTWDALNRLVFAERVENGVARRVRFGYDYTSARVVKRAEKSDGTPEGLACGQSSSAINPNFFEDTALYIDATTESRACRLTKYVLANGHRVARIVSDTPSLDTYKLDLPAPYTFFFHADHLSSSSAVTARNGQVVNHIAYRPYGSIDAEQTDPAFANFSSDQKYTDKELDEELGLVYFGARYYWAETGRWVSPDSRFLADPQGALQSPRTLNLYGYVEGNPFSYVDPLGLKGEFVGFVTGWALEATGGVRGQLLTLAGGIVPAQVAQAYGLIETGSAMGAVARQQETVGAGVRAAVNVVNPVAQTLDALSGAMVAAEDEDWEAAGRYSYQAAQGAAAVLSIAIGGAKLLAAKAPVAAGGGPKLGSADPAKAGKRFPGSVKEQARAESGGKCVFCKTKTGDPPGPTKSEIDHAIPKSRGGDNTIDNAQNTCRTCNRTKGAQTTEEFLK